MHTKSLQKSIYLPYTANSLPPTHAQREGQNSETADLLLKIKLHTCQKKQQKTNLSPYLIKLYDVRMIQKLHDLNLTIYFLQVTGV